MNLADIRKKAEEQRKSAPAPTPETSAEVFSEPEQELAGYPVAEDSVFDSFSMPSDDFMDEEVPSVAPAEAEVFDEKEPSAPATPPVVAAPERLAIYDSPEDFHEESLQPIAVRTSPAGRKVSVYNPLETILQGRESAADVEGDALFSAHVYADEAVAEYLCFRVADEEYAISIMAIKEIVKPREVTEVPRMPQFISGVISLRGVIIPVMDMRLRLSLSSGAATGRERIVVLRTESGFCGVLVDEVVQVARIRKSDIEEPPAVLDGIDRDFVTGLGHFDSRILILLNLETILNIGVH